MTNTLMYPCDRGVKGNVMTRGWHNFGWDAVSQKAICRLCGKESQHQASHTPRMSY